MNDKQFRNLITVLIVIAVLVALIAFEFAALLDHLAVPL